MPTLENLFKNGTLERGPYAGQTPKDAFYPRNANKISLSSNSPVINQKIPYQIANQHTANSR